MLERKKIYRFTEDWTLTGTVQKSFVKGEYFVLNGVLCPAIHTHYGIYMLRESDLLSLAESCELVPDQLSIGSVVRVVRYSDVSGTRWGDDVYMKHTLEERGVLESVGMGRNNAEPWYKVKINGKHYYYDRNSLELTELADNETMCDDCGRIVDRDDTYTTADDRTICYECYDDHYGTCEDCGAVVAEEELSCIDDRYICDSCREDHYTVCPQCNTWFYVEDGYCDDCTDELYCSERCLDEATCGRYFHEYNYKPQPDYHKLPDETSVAGYYGVELELELNGADRASTARDITVAGKDFVYCKHDGSLYDGIEIVSHPATYAYHMADTWEKIINAAVEDGMQAETSCGLHIHASRTLFGEAQLAQELTIAKVLYCFERLWDTIVIFSRRESVSYIEDWARKSDTDIKGTDDDVTVRDKLRKNGPRSRYSAVNLCNDDTVEFRIFASTTDVAKLLGSIGFVHTLILYCNTHTIKQCQLLTWDTLTKYAVKRSPKFYELSKKLIKVGK